MKKILLSIVLILCVVISLSACGQETETSSIPPPEDTSGISGDVLLPDASDTSTSEPEPSEPETSETTTPATNSTPTSNPANNTAGTTSKSTPPANNTPSQAPSQPATSTPAPANSSAPTTTSQPPAKPTYTETDYQRIIDTIRTYGEAKGFVWKDDFAFGQSGLGYYGRPNLERDGYDGVVNMLKYNCDTIFDNGGICYFKVVKHIYENQTEFVVLYG